MINSSVGMFIAFFGIELSTAFLCIITGMLPLYVIIVILGIVCSILEGRI